MSNFSEFHQDFEYASHVLFSLGWIFADFVRWQPAVIFTTSCFNNSRLDQSQHSELSTYFVFFHWLYVSSPDTIIATGQWSISTVVCGK